MPTLTIKRTKEEILTSKMTTMQQTILTTDNNKKRAAAIRRLSKAVAQSPAIAQELGIEAQPSPVVRVMAYGCLAGPVVIDEPVFADMARQQMMLRHDMYNYMVGHSRKLYAMAYKELMSGPNFKANQETYDKIGSLYGQIREINKAARSKVASAEVNTILEEISTLKESAEALRPEAQKELTAFYKGDVYKSIMGSGGLLSSLTKAAYREYTARGLYNTNYNPCVTEFTNAFTATFKTVKTLMAGLTPRYASKDGSYPESLQAWGRWDGAGRTGTTITQKMTKDKTGINPQVLVSGVMDGTNKWFRLRPITEADMPHFPLGWVRLGSKRSERLYIAEVRVQGPRAVKSILGSEEGRPVFASIPVVLHRPLPSNALFSSAVIESKRVGLKLVHNLLVTVSFPSEVPSTEGAVAKLTLGSKDLNIAGMAVREQTTAFTKWASTSGGQQRGSVPGQRFEWLEADGTLRTSAFMGRASSFCEDLDGRVTEHMKQAIGRLITLVPEVKMPDWFYAADFDITKRRQIRHLYHHWCTKLAEADPSGEVRTHLRALRQKGRILVKKDWDMASDMLAFTAESLLKMEIGQARVFVILSLATERYEHLYPWAVNVRARSLRRRKDEYRQFAYRFLDGVREVHIPAARKSAKRFIGPAERSLAGSTLVEAVRAMAERRGISIIAV